jgi:hypothetical protein
MSVGILWRERNPRAALRPFLTFASIMAGFLFTFGGWTVYQNHRGVKNWVNPNAINGLKLTGSKVGDMASNFFDTFQHLTMSYWLQPQINGESVSIWAALLCAVFVGAPFAVMAINRSWSLGWMLGLGTLLGISAVPLAVQLQVYQANDEYFGVVASRYAITFLPWTIMCLAVVAHRRRLWRSTQIFVALGAVVMVLAELHILNLGPALVSRSAFLVG